MKVLITGVDGYIGCVLAPVLRHAGHDVVGLDTGFYRDGWLYHDALVAGELPRTVTRDIRRIEPEILHGLDAVVHLAELSNDPLGENSPAVTYEINHAGSVRLARLAREAGVRRFVYTSSCSVYGVSGADLVDERSPTDPQTAYAECKVLTERDVKELATADFSPTFLRNATAFGASPRMRFDIVVNNLTGLAWTTKKIAMSSDGTPWRPLVHVLDICAAIRAVLEAPDRDVHNEVFNVGRRNANYTIREVAEIVGMVFADCEITFGPPSADNRSYRVSFEKIHERLPGFRPEWSVEDGVRQLHALYSRIGMSAERFDFRAFTRLKQLKYLIRTGQIDSSFFWSTAGTSIA